jgi:hypothetical protein
MENKALRGTNAYKSRPPTASSAVKKKQKLDLAAIPEPKRRQQPVVQEE